MSKLVVEFSGWLEIPLDSVKLCDFSGEEMITKTAEQWLSERGNLNGLILDSLADAYRNATDEDSDISFTVEEE